MSYNNFEKFLVAAENSPRGEVTVGNRAFLKKLFGCEVIVQFYNNWYKARPDQKDAILAAFLEWKFGMRTMGGQEPNVYEDSFGRSVKTGTPFSVRFTPRVRDGETEFKLMSGDGEFHQILFKFPNNPQFGYFKSLPQILLDYPTDVEREEGAFDPVFTDINVCE